MASPNKITIRVNPNRYTENRTIRVTGRAGRVDLVGLNFDQDAVPLTPGTTAHEYLVNLLTSVLAAVGP